MHPVLIDHPSKPAAESSSLMTIILKDRLESA
jgi:hypothetical protein